MSSFTFLIRTACCEMFQTLHQSFKFHMWRVAKVDECFF